MRGLQRIHPFDCVVGCSNCAGLCEEGASGFTPLTILKGIGG
jgi:hypothetical protein